jgi:hypothetical protein
MCFRTISIVTDHTNTTFQKQSALKHVGDISHVTPLSKSFSVLASHAFEEGRRIEWINMTMISGFRRDVDEICTLLGYYAA